MSAISMRRFAALLGMLGLAAASCVGAPDRSGPAPSQTTILSYLTVIDGNGGPPLEHRDIVIRGDRIAEVRASRPGPAPRGANVIDMTGRFAMPGLIDAHVHLESQQRDPETVSGMLRAALLGGVTTVRDMGGNGPTLQRLARAAETAEAPSPRIHFSSLVIGEYSDFWLTDDKGRFVAGDTTPGTSVWFRRIDEHTDLAAFVGEAKRFGVTGLKIHSGVAPELLMRLGAEARRQGVTMWSHAAINPSRPSDAVNAGVSVLSHADMLAFEGLPLERSLLTIPAYRIRAAHAVASTPPQSETITRLLETMKRRGVMLEPTLFIINFGRARAPEADRARLSAHAAYAAAITRRANALGIPIVAGSDSMILGSSPNIHAELQLLVSEGGLTPLQAITAATRTGARVLGIDRDVGTVASGKRADLVILTADPSRDVRNTLTISDVYRGGRRFGREAPLPPPPLAQAPTR